MEKMFLWKGKKESDHHPSQVELWASRGNRGAAEFAEKRDGLEWVDQPRIPRGLKP
jgi:hypothetical protein